MGLGVYMGLGVCRRLYGDILGLYWVYMAIVEKNMETTIMGYIGKGLGFKV